MMASLQVFDRIAGGRFAAGDDEFVDLAPGRPAPPWRSMTDLLLPNNGNRLLAAFTRYLPAVAKRDLRSTHIAQGRILYEVGSPVDTIYFPESGLISLLVVTSSGSMIETATIGKDGAVGLQAVLGRRQSFTRATIQIGGAFTVVPVSRFAQYVANNRQVQDLIGQYTEVLWAEAQQTTACNATHDGASRLCRWLLQSADRIGSNEVPLTQEFLAQMLGVRRTTVTLLAQAMQSKGLISYSRGRITLLDREHVERCACECYQVMRRDRLVESIGVQL